MPTDAERYRLLKSWLLTTGNAHWIYLDESVSEPFVMDTYFYGESFDAAVDTLPEIHHRFHTVLHNNRSRKTSSASKQVFPDCLIHERGECDGSGPACVPNQLPQPEE